MNIKVYKSVLIFFLLIIFSGASHGKTVFPEFAYSADKVPISYGVYGKGGKTIVLIHAWSCDSRYWKYQIPYLENKYKLVVLDLAGHGHSGMDRKNYTMESFGEDVAAVVRKSCKGKVVLVGHSIGGPVAVEAAKILGGRVLGIVGVDNFTDVSYKMTDKAFDKRVGPLKKDFRKECRKFVDYMLTPKPAKDIEEWIKSDMSSAPENVALSAIINLYKQFQTGYTSSVFKEVRLPVIIVNGDLRPINFKANKKHMLYFDSIVMKNSDHFLNLTKPDEFNPNLEKAIERIFNYAEK